MISIVTVNWWAKDFFELLKDTSFANAKNDIELIVVDNSGELKDYKDVRVIKPRHNLRHGGGLDLGIKNAKNPYILVLDVDSHLLLHHWDIKLIEEYNRKDVKILAAQGGLLKPIRPCTMFFERDLFIENDYMSFQPKVFEGFKMDVGIHFYFRTLSKYHEKADFFKYNQTEYTDVLGNEYSLNNERFVYHNWYGTRFYGPNDVCKDKVDNITFEEFITKKDNLFKQVDNGNQ